MTIDYLYGKWNRMWNNITRQRTEKKERLEIIIIIIKIIIIKLLQLCVGVCKREENKSKEREQMIEHDK
jgi:hypothetical protein